MAPKVIQLTPLDLVDAWTAQRRSVAAHQAMQWLAILGFGVFSLAAIMAVVLVGPAKAAPAVLMAGLFAVALAAPRYMNPIRARRVHAQQKSLREDILVTWDDKTITWQSPHGVTNYPWTDFWKFLEGKETLVFLQSSSIMNVLPKRYLADAEVDEIRRRMTETAA